jgi:hypothetical protein
MAQAQTEFRLRLQLERARSLPLAVPSRVFRVIGKQEVILLLPDCPSSSHNRGFDPAGSPLPPDSAVPALLHRKKTAEKRAYTDAVQDGDPGLRHYRLNPIGPRVSLFQPRTFQPRRFIATATRLSAEANTMNGEKADVARRPAPQNGSGSESWSGANFRCWPARPPAVLPTAFPDLEITAASTYVPGAGA